MAGRGSLNQPRGWSRAPHPRVPGPHPHPPAPWAGLRGSLWLGARAPTACQSWAFPEGLWRLGLGHGDFLLLSLSFPSLLRAALSPSVLVCFQGVSRLPRRTSFSYQKKKMFLVRPGERSQERSAGSASVFPSLCSLGSPLASQEQNRRAYEQSRAEGCGECSAAHALPGAAVGPWATLGFTDGGFTTHPQHSPR